MGNHQAIDRHEEANEAAVDDADFESHRPSDVVALRDRVHRDPNLRGLFLEYLQHYSEQDLAVGLAHEYALADESHSVFRTFFGTIKSASHVAKSAIVGDSPIEYYMDGTPQASDRFMPSPGCTGVVVFDSDLRARDLPVSEFFSPGRAVYARCRFGTLSGRECDRAVRSVSLSMFTGTAHARFDIGFATGPAAPFHSANTYSELCGAVGCSSAEAREAALRGYLMRQPTAFVAMQQALKYPQPYRSYHYYSHVTYEWRGATSGCHLARFRLCPVASSHETPVSFAKVVGATSPDPWDDAAPAGLTTSCLSDEIEEYLSTRPIEYLLQVQTRVNGGHEWELNPAVPWNANDHPWCTIATVMLDRAVQRSTAQGWSFSPSYHPVPFIGIPTSSHDDDFRSLLSNRACRRGVALSTAVSGLCSYQIEVHSNRARGAGTGAAVFVALHGESGGSTKPMRLAYWAENRLADRHSDVFTVYASQEVGKVAMLHLKLVRHRSYALYFVDKVVVKNPRNGEEYTFIVGKWLEEGEITAFEATPVLLQYERDQQIRIARGDSVFAQRKKFLWDRTGVAKLPGHTQRKASSNFSMLAASPAMVTHMELDAEERALRSARALVLPQLVLEPDYGAATAVDDFVALLEGASDPCVPALIDWRSDAFFGSLFLDGPFNALMNRLAPGTAIPPGLHDLNVFRDPNMPSLVTASQMGVLYYADCTPLHGLPCREGRYVAPAWMLFVLSGETLLPIAIRLEVNSRFAFTPPTVQQTSNLWTLAKTHAACAAIHMTHCVDKALHSELCVEPVLLAALRQLPEVHPVHKLLYHHCDTSLRNLAASHDRGRGSTDLINGSGVHDRAESRCGWSAELLSLSAEGIVMLQEAMYQKWDLLSVMHYPTHSADRGMDGLLRGSREEGSSHSVSLQLWEALESFVSEVLGLCYENDEDVVRDSELRGWLQEAHSVGHFALADPIGPVNDLRSLTGVVTSIIWCVTVKHHQLCHGLWTWCAFAPATPFSMRAPPPPLFSSDQTGVEIDEGELLAALPALADVARQLVHTHSNAFLPLQSGYDNMGSTPVEQFCSPETISIHKRFIEKLSTVGEAVRKREDFTLLSPLDVPNYMCNV